MGYCQSLNYIAAFLLCAMRRDPSLPPGAQEEAAFWILSCVATEILPRGMFARDLLGARAELSAIDSIMARKWPRTAAALASLGLPASSYATGWVMCCLTRGIPAETAARAWDVLLAEGSKVLVRYSLALIRRAAAAVEGAGDAGEALEAFQARPTRRQALALLPRGNHGP